MNNRKNVFLSVIIPTYNRAVTIRKAIESVQKQKIPLNIENAVTFDNLLNIEIIVIDDRSNDNTRSVVEEMAKEDNRIVYLYNEGNKGAGAARNVGLKNANGKYIAFLDSDDVWFDNHIESSFSVLSDKNKVSFALWLEKKALKKTKKFLEKADVKQKIENAEKYCGKRIGLNAILFNENLYEFTVLTDFYCFQINTLIIERSVVEDVGLFIEGLKANEDSDFTYRIMQKYEIILILEEHFIYHLGPDNIYFYIDRSDIDLVKIRDEKAMVNRLTTNGISENQMRKRRIDFVKKSSKIIERKKCIDRLKMLIFNRYLTLAYLNGKNYKMNSLKFLIRSFGFGFNSATLIVLKSVFRDLKESELTSIKFDLG